MQRRKKINRIKSLIDKIQDRKDVHFCKKFFYSDRVHLYEDKDQTIKITESEASAYAEAERLENNAENKNNKLWIIYPILKLQLNLGHH